MKLALGRLSAVLSPPKADPINPAPHKSNAVAAGIAALIKSGVFGMLLAGVGQLVPSLSAANPVLGAALFALVSFGTTMLRLYSADPATPLVSARAVLVPADPNLGSPPPGFRGPYPDPLAVRTRDAIHESSIPPKL